jgi:hypothetical protein
MRLIICIFAFDVIFWALVFRASDGLIIQCQRFISASVWQVKQGSFASSDPIEWFHSQSYLNTWWDWHWYSLPKLLVEGVRLSPLGTSATNWPIVPALDDRWWVWISRWNENWQGKPKCSEKTCPSATLSTTNPTWPELGSDPGCRGGNPATNRLSYGTAFFSQT